jgi:hypothetical protein
VLLAGIASQAWCSDGVFLNRPFSNRSIGFPAPQTVDPISAQADGFRAMFTSPIHYSTIVTPRWRDPISDAEHLRIDRLPATTTWFSGKLGTEAEAAYNPTGVSQPMPSIMGNTPTDASARMFRIGLTGSEGNLRYGVIFRHAGQGFLLSPDRASREIWGEWKTGWMTFRNVIGQAWNNVEGEATRARLEQTYGRVGLSLSKPQWPELSVTYSRNSLNSVFEPIGVAPQRSSNHTIEGAVTLQRPGWDIRFASSYILVSDLLRSDADSNIRAQTLSAILRPINRLTITPAFAYRQEFQSQSGVRIDNPTASLALSFQQTPKLLFSAVGNYSSSHSSDGLIHNENLRWKGALDWSLYSSAGWVTKIGVEAGYNRVTDRVARSTDTEDISGLVRLGIVGR